jgi:hypothetical protein
MLADAISAQINGSSNDVLFLGGMGKFRPVRDHGFSVRALQLWVDSGA